MSDFLLGNHKRCAVLQKEVCAEEASVPFQIVIEGNCELYN